jgi:hypothetical protein
MVFKKGVIYLHKDTKKKIIMVNDCNVPEKIAVQYEEIKPKNIEDMR